MIFSDHSPLEVSTKPLDLPPGSSENPYGEAQSAEVNGTGWTDGTGYQKCPLIFFILCGSIDKVYNYLYM